MILGVGTRFADFTTGSWALFKNPDRRLISINVQPFDAAKHRALSVVGDARTALAALDAKLGGWKAPRAWSDEAAKAKAEWEATAARYTAPTNAPAPTDAEVLGALMRAGEKSRRRRLRRRRTAGRIAQAVAGGRAARLPSRIRLFVHGLRDRRRDRRQDGAARPGSDRGARRRLVSDDEFRDRDLRDAGPEAHHRRQRQSRLRLHQPAATGDRRRAVQQSPARRAARSAAGGRLRRPRARARARKR